MTNQLNLMNILHLSTSTISIDNLASHCNIGCRVGSLVSRVITKRKHAPLNFTRIHCLPKGFTDTTCSNIQINRKEFFREATADMEIFLNLTCWLINGW
ncbi:MAG: hypothetical protein [Circular genetic element sp.]|nr:MAG: hypothetical protein [Circular genetic element sp.]